MKMDAVQRLYQLLAVPLFRIYRGPGLLLQLTGLCCTVILVFSGIDWAFYQWAGSNDGVVQFAFTAAVVGMFIPVLAPVFLYMAGPPTQRPWFKTIAIALVQAAALSVMVSGTYKAFTGRAAPEYSVSFSGASLQVMERDITRAWDFGFMNAGVFDGWPSGHTTTAFSTATALALLIRRRSVRVLAFLYAMYIGLGVGITIHWLSDAVMGMFLGIAIGRAVAASWKGGE